MTFLNAVGDTSFGDILSKRLLMPGGAVAPSVAPELFPCVVLENDRPEWLYLAGQGLYEFFVQVGAGGAGTRASAWLYNSSPDLLVVVEGLEAVVASGQVRLAMVGLPAGTLPFGTYSAGVSADGRAKAPSSAAVRRSQANIVTDNTLGSQETSTNRLWVSSGTTLVRTSAWVLGPFTGLYVCPSADNVVLTSCAFRWRERRLNPSERV